MSNNKAIGRNNVLASDVKVKIQNVSGVGTGPNALNKKDLDIEIAKVKTFFPFVDKALVVTRNDKRELLVDIGHDMLNGEVGITFLPDGEKYTDTTYNTTGLKPHDDYMCVIGAYNGNYNGSGGVILNFITMADSLINNSVVPGTVLISNKEQLIEISDKSINISTDDLQFNNESISSAIESTTPNFLDEVNFSREGNIVGCLISSLDVSITSPDIWITLDIHKYKIPADFRPLKDVVSPNGSGSGFIRLTTDGYLQFKGGTIGSRTYDLSTPYIRNQGDLNL